MERTMQLSPRAVPYFMMQALLPGLFISVWMAGMLSGVQSSSRGALAIHFDSLQQFAISAALVVVLLMVLNWCYCSLKARSYRIDMKNEGIVLEYGIVSKNHEILLFKNIQDVVISCNIVERMLGLSTVVIQNAMGKPERIPGLDSAAAEALRDEIVQRAAR
jgi:membrane protein YdbS with pleckstrin-like domain